MHVRRPRLLESLVILLLSSVLVIVGRPQIGRVEYQLLDFRFALTRILMPTELPEQLSVVMIDQKSEADFGRSWDYSWREYYPDLASVLETAGARLIVWDFIFSDRRPDLDDALEAALGGPPPSIVSEGSSAATDPFFLSAPVGIGWISDMMAVRSVPRRIGAHETPPPLGAVVADFLAGSTSDIATARQGKTVVERAITQDLWLDFAYDPLTIPRFGLSEVLAHSGGRLGDDQGTPLSVFKDRVVYVGVDLPATDRGPLPGGGAESHPRVYAQIVALASFLSDRPIRQYGGAVGRSLALPVAVVLSLVLGSLRRRIRIWGTVFGVTLSLLIPSILFLVWRIWVPYTASLIAAIVPIGLYAIIRTLKLSRSYRTSLGFDPELIGKERDLESLGSAGVERYAAVLCADVRGYTEYVSSTPSQVVQTVIQEYLKEMEAIIDRHGGYVNKYVGDEIVAVFGFPREEDGVADRSVQAALEMLSRLTELQAGWQARGVPGLKAIGIGLDAGVLRFSHIGGSRRIQFDIIGSATNGASRLQTLTKTHKRALILPAEMVENQSTLEVLMYGADATTGPVVSFIGEALVRGQGRRRLYGLV